jgi:nucleotide-binding universal stress UspA family protein
MALNVILLCTDGSEGAINALSAGFALLKPAERVLVITVVDDGDPTLITGSGLAGGVMTQREFDELEQASEADGRAIAEQTAAALGIVNAEIQVERGAAGSALCRVAAELSASAMVIGSRGRGGIKRALLGSVSDYVVRNAPCPVVIMCSPS